MAIEIQVPQLGESISEATVARWMKAPGDAVEADEPLVELETDKVTVEVPAPRSGVLEEILAGEGEEVEVGAVLGRMAAGAVAAKTAPAPKAKEQAPAPSDASAPSNASAPLSPAVRKLLADNALAPEAVAGTGKDGRITKADVLGHLEAAAAAPPAPAPVPAAPAPPRPPRPDHPREERVRMSRLRRRVAERLKDAQNTAAMLTTFNEADMSGVVALRRRYREAFEKRHGVRLGFMSFFVKACIGALKEIPAVNAEIDGGDIIYKNHYDIGVAVGTAQGLVVPVLKDADAMSFAEVEHSIADLGARARDGKLSMEDLTGGTFTISNGGVYGSLMSAPILNPPQSGILGMHKIEDRPVAVDGKVEIRPMMYLALSYDHRIIDGSESVTFLVRVKEAIENPERLLLDV
ncbi:MAG: 2-oxoglutarate dehydrogenase complex dihydrolipoyllysine-residue succinyltransferase [Alphaproteobacteria bacterium]|nr:2-oxoglutarate dehydrogenase complex dihydrolipoyllysine-residue succinyltransferase [Alphaproteobacteria bacterium]